MPNVGSSDVGVKGRVIVVRRCIWGHETVPIPNIEELTTYLKFHLFGDSNVLRELQVLVVVAKASKIGDALPLAKIEVETVEVFESTHIEQRLVGIETTLTL
jgi:hypothetical protein